MREMQPILINLELLDLQLPGLKQRLFEWIVDLEQPDFDQLCNEILGLQRFWEKYQGAIVTDAVEIIAPFLPILPKVELVVEMDDRHFDRNYFYRWLSQVNEQWLQMICEELGTLCDQALENVDAYVVIPLFPELQKRGICWRIEHDRNIHLPLVQEVICSWRR
jgi:hypothetical protein